MKRAHVVVLLLIIGAALASGCVSRADYLKNATFGSSFYDFNKVHYWKNNVTMYGGGTSSTWDMAVDIKNDTLDGAPVRYMKIVTEGNGMNITYDVWSNATTLQVLKMHAKGTQGDYFQDRDTSSLQIYTLPDVGLSYYFVPFWPIKNTTVKTSNGVMVPITIYSASDNKGFTVTYTVSPLVPVPIRVEMAGKDYKIVETLIDYR